MSSTSVNGVTCEHSISANPFISLERTPCPVQQCCTAGSDDKKIGLQRHAYTSTRCRKTFSTSTAKVPSFHPFLSFLLDYEKAVLSFANKPCARNTLRNRPRSPTMIPMRREKKSSKRFHAASRRVRESHQGDAISQIHAVGMKVAASLHAALNYLH